MKNAFTIEKKLPVMIIAGLILVAGLLKVIADSQSRVDY
jgi:hypothetical protein